MKATTLRGTVVRGDGLGRRLGFPTANIRVVRQKLPRFGVYEVLARLPSWARARAGACNVGVRPTLKGPPRLRVEVHLPGYRGNLYGRKLEIVFVRRLRPEKKFPSLAALKAQIRKDVRGIGARPGQRASRKVQ